MSRSEIKNLNDLNENKYSWKYWFLAELGKSEARES